MHARRIVRNDLGGLSVLVVDDHRDGADSAAALLALGGHRVRVAYDGPSALTAVAEEPPDVVLLDLRMPGMDGLEVARRIPAALPAGSRAPRVVAVTGLQAQERAAAEAGVDLVLLKPADPGALLTLLRRMRGGVQARDSVAGA
jgi:CheY-like chemotaxis protein